MKSGGGKGASELTGADWFLITVERSMRASGQGRHVGLSVLELGPGFDESGLRSAVGRLAAASPVVAGKLSKLPFGVPRWKWTAGATAEFPVIAHDTGERWEVVGERLLAEDSDSPLSFHIVRADGGTTLLVRWRHVFLDGKGAELLLAEVARLASEPDSQPPDASWGPLDPKPKDWRHFVAQSEIFRDHFYKLSEHGIRSLGGSKPTGGHPRFFVERFTAEESGRIAERAAAVSKAMFQIGWFLAAAMRAHRAVLTARGENAESFQAGCAVQQRKRGARHPIWQNQVSQLFFSLSPAELADLAEAAGLLQMQFAAMSRARLDGAFAVVARTLRRMPSWLYLRMLRRNSGGHLTSFFFSHTGEFMPESATFCGAAINHAWHIPSVSQPPGTGIFFGQRNDALTATYAWRDGVITAAELDALRASVRSDLLGL